MWSHSTKSGYLLNFEMYQGNNPRRNVQYEKEFGKAAAPLVAMLDEIPVEKRNLCYRIYFDNLFTGSNLLTYLKERGYFATDTIRANRIPKSCPLTEKRVFSKKVRETYESVIDGDHGILSARWLDNGIVSIASTCYGIIPIANVKRYCQSQKSHRHPKTTYNFSIQRMYGRHRSDGQKRSAAQDKYTR
ncbi:Transposase IS4 [Popillia japonica]|uniref:Transposase IS4 n=1 Tax=Popillia japonica TaxID=7064 RepID=A0AAW1M7R1_POPJA